MKHCIKCQLDLPDSYSFCKFCGGPLAERAVRPNGGKLCCPACGAAMKSGWRFCKQCACDLQTLPGSHASQPCRGCGSQVAADLNFCLKCGTPVAISEPQAVTPSAGFADAAVVLPMPINETDEQTLIATSTRTSQGREDGSHVMEGVGARSASRAAFDGIPSKDLASRRRLNLALILSAAVVLLTVVGLATYYFWYRNNTVQKKLDAAITRGDLLKPEGASAYDYYNQLKNNGVDFSVLQSYAEKLLPKLTAPPLKVLEEFAVPTNREPDISEWQQTQKAMTWASELNPSDDSLAAKARYVEGRVAYLNNKKDEALVLWKRASELDKSWALAANAIGVLYNERKEYQTARQFALEAIRREPTWAVPYNNVGTSYFLEKSDDKAESYYLQAIERAPNWPRPHVWLGDMGMRSKNYSRAVVEYETALNLAVPGTTTLDLTEIKKRLEIARKESQGLGNNDAEIAGANSSWPAFLAAFRAAVKKRDRATLRGMIAAPFRTQSDGEIRSPDEVLKWLDDSDFWEQLEREIGIAADLVFWGQGGRPQRCTKGIFCFEYGKDGQWRLAEQGENEGR